MKMVSRTVMLGLALSLSACSDFSFDDMGESTKLGAATGGAIGAGLGAIVGSQTGSAGGGLVIGALAGSAAGGAIGQSFDAQERTIRTQDEAIERHERTIVAQRTELEELRRSNLDSALARTEPSLRTPPQQLAPAGSRIPQTDFAPHASLGRVAPVPAMPGSPNAQAALRPSFREARPFEPAPQFQRDDTGRGALAPQATFPERPVSQVQEQTLVDHSAEYRRQRELQSNLASSTLPSERVIANASPRIDAPFEQPRAVGSDIGAFVPNQAPARVINLNTPECIQAEGEISKAGQSAELADKLFHYRRALRLCPENPAYHNGLGEIYVSLNRRNDAEFEFREALNLDPQFAPAQNNLNNLK